MFTAMKTNGSRVKWLSGIFAAALLAGCSGAPDTNQEPDTQAPAVADQAQTVAKLHMKAEDGTEADFLLPDGAAVKVTNERLGIAYRLTGQVIDATHLIVTVEQFNDVELKSLTATDVLYLDQEKESRALSAITPFSLRMLGLESDTLRSSPGYGTESVTPQSSLLTCCVTCGGWKVCCTPTPGHCCQISSSCGLGCKVCN